VQSKLTADYRRNVARNMLFAAELERLLHLLEDAGIRVIPLKGVPLAESLYGDPALRVCSDTDILVAAADALRARSLILSNGYTSPFSEDFFAKHQFHTSADCPLVLERGGLSYFLELHWTLLQHSSKDAKAMEDLWSEARPREFFGAKAFSLTPEWEFIYLSTHAAYHKWQTLKWIADINDLCATTSIDWETMQKKAATFGLGSVVKSTLAVCSTLYGTPVPPNFSPVELPPGVPLFPHSLDPAEAWNSPLFQAKLLNRPSEKLRWFAEMLFVARMSDRLAFPLPESLSFLYYLLRPLRLAAKWSKLFLLAGIGRLRRWLRPLPR
jgi:hypothetical protein